MFFPPRKKMHAAPKLISARGNTHVLSWYASKLLIFLTHDLELGGFLSRQFLKKLVWASYEDIAAKKQLVQ